jgi:peptidoglycan/xylan/chitin deacetylase (PgdA/CDA1 family)
MIEFVLRKLSRDKLSIFLFHKVPVMPTRLAPYELVLADFLRMLDYVAEHFSVIPLDEAIVLLDTGRKLPPRAACLTFDDGYRSWVEHVMPALLERGLHATFFVTTGQFSDKPMWHERVEQAMTLMPEGRLDLVDSELETLTIADEATRLLAVRRVEQYLKYLPLARRERLIAHLENLSGTDPLVLDRMPEADVRTLHAKGFAIGAHTINHPILTLCNEQEARDEIAVARESLAALTGGQVNGFAYPNGRPAQDFNERHVRLVREAGYRYAVTTQWGAATAGTSLFQIPRFTPWGPSAWHMSYQLARNYLLPGKMLGITESALV